MKKELAKKSVLFMSIVFVVGCLLIISSTSIGQNIGEKAITSSSGSMDTSQYEQIIATSTASYQRVGTVISAVGGIGLLLSGFALYKELE